MLSIPIYLIDLSLSSIQMDLFYQFVVIIIKKKHILTKLKYIPLPKFGSNLKDNYLTGIQLNTSNETFIYYQTLMIETGTNHNFIRITITYLLNNHNA